MKWEKVKLKDICVSITDGTHQAPPKTDFGIPFITIANITGFNKIDFSNTNFVTKEYYETQDEKRTAKPNDILYSVVGSFGIPVYIKEDVPFVFQRHIAILKTNENVDAKYLYYVMLSKEFYQKADTVALGAAQRTISLNSLRNLEVVLPPIDIQNRISSILSTYDDLIENNQKQIKLLEEAAQRIYKEWFVDLRFPGHENVKIVDGVPEGWEKQTIDDLADYINGFAFKPSDWGMKGKPIIKIREMVNGIKDDTPRNIGDAIPKKYIVKSGDVLFSWSATLTAMIWTAEDGLLNQHIFKVVPKGNLPREFVLQSILFTLEEFKNLTTGSTMKHIQRGKLKEVVVLIPSKSLLEKYNSLSESIRNNILNLSRKVNLLQEARDRLLPKLISGEIEL